MPSAGFEPIIPTSERPQTNALDRIRDIKPTKRTVMFLRYLHCSITLNIPACFDPHGNIIRRLNRTSMAWNQIIQCSWFGVKESNSENVDSLSDPLTFIQMQLDDICICLLVLLNQTAAFPLCSFTLMMFWYSWLQLACWALVNFLFFKEMSTF